jgi:fibronectin-binding autotransporter adhesin
VPFTVGGGLGTTRVFAGAEFESGSDALLNTVLQLDTGATARWTSAATQVGALAGAGSAIIGASSTSASVLEVGANDLSTTFAGVLSDNITSPGLGGLTKTGAGTLTLTGGNTYDGPTLIKGGGALFINRSLSASTSKVAVDANSAFGGTGAVSRSVVVNGKMDPGEDFGATGTLEIGDSLDLTGTSILNIEVAGPTPPVMVAAITTK